MLCLPGAPAVRVGDVHRPLKLRPKAMALLVRVALEGPTSRAELANLIFGEAVDPRATPRWHLTYLRAQLPEPVRQYLRVTPDRIAFDAPTDVEVFRRGARRFLDRAADPEIANVLSRYRGDLCAGLTVSASAVFETWLYVEQEGLRRLFRQATVALARQALAAGDTARVVEPLAQLVTVDPYYEAGHSLLIEANETLGRRAAAAAAYQRYQRASRADCGGLILLDGVVGDRAFTENAAAQVIKPIGTTLELRVGGFDEYLTRWRAQLRTYSDEGERVLERTIRYELAPLPDGAYRRRAVRASLRTSDSLGALSKVRCPTLIVQATRPWPEGRSYLPDATIVAQRNAVPHAQVFVARQSDHPLLVRDPEPEMVETVRNFVLSLAK